MKYVRWSDHPKCPFINKYMKKPCNSTLFKNHHEWWCIKHGTITSLSYKKDEILSDYMQSIFGLEQWSMTELKNLVRSFASGKSLDEMSMELGRNKNSIVSKLSQVKKGLKFY